MSAKVRVKSRKRGKAALAWLPAMFTVGAGIVAALGISLVPSATSAPVTATTTVNVTASVGQEVHISNGCAGAVTYGSSLATSDPSTDLGNCTFTFGTNNASPLATLSVRNTNGSAPFFCKRSTPGNPTTACTAPAAEKFTDHVGANTALADGEFGGKIAVAGDATGCTLAGWTAGATNFNPIGTAATNVCTQNAMGTDATYKVTFGANPQASGAGSAAVTYEGQATATATAGT